MSFPEGMPSVKIKNPSRVDPGRVNEKIFVCLEVNYPFSFLCVWIYNCATTNG
jgi:hypothetical protein